MIVNFVIGGQPHNRGLSGHENLGDVCAAVGVDMGHFKWVEWEARLLDGRMLDSTQEVAMQVSHNESVYLQPRAGVGG